MKEFFLIEETFGSFHFQNHGYWPRWLKRGRPYFAMKFIMLDNQIMSKQSFTHWFQSKDVAIIYHVKWWYAYKGFFSKDELDLLLQILPVAGLF